MKWYSFNPGDTLFFRGAEPMTLGADHSASLMFPPSADTIAGALRTAVIAASGTGFEDYAAGKAADSIYNAVGKAGSESPFTVAGPLFMFNGKVFIPVPHSWYALKEQKENAESNKEGKPAKIKIMKPSDTGNTGLVVTKTGGENRWVKIQKGDLDTLEGFWIAASDLSAGEAEVYPVSAFFSGERRTGIALGKKDKTSGLVEESREVREGHLYSFVHARLKPGVTIIFGTETELPLPEKFILKLGGEQRFGLCESIKAPELKQGNGSSGYMALSIVPGDNNTEVIASGKIKYIGGWDMHKRFHKPMRGYYPAGAVFKTKTSENMIAL
ncbi:MAG TPA: type III-B CRISPR module-associated Cmr3 family protein [Spirochaetota bacterium]|nr:type III-B CRISPR module-associated Cmr3 family protein [Spirochaetota bacterium]